MAQYYTNFTGEKTGAISQSTNWTEVLSVAGRSTNIIHTGDSKHLQIVAGNNSGNNLIAFDNSKNVTGIIESLVQFSVDTAVQNPGSFGVLAHNYNSNGGFSLGFTPANNILSIILFDDHAAVTVNSATFAWTTDTKYWLRFRTDGNDQYIKIWADGDPEPGSWTFSAPYNIGTWAGDKYSGVMTYSPDSTITFYQYGFATNGDTAPSAPPAIPTSTPVANTGGGYGGTGYGMMYGTGTTLLRYDTTLVINSLQQSHALDTVSLSQYHYLTAQDLQQAHYLDSLGVFDQNSVLSIDDLLQAHNLDQAVVVPNNSPIPRDMAQGHSLDSVQLLQNHYLTVDNLSQSHSLDDIQLTQHHHIIIQGTSQNHTLDPIILTQQHHINAESLQQLQTLESPSLFQRHLLSVQNMLQQHSLDDVVLSSNMPLVIANLWQGHSLDDTEVLVKVKPTPQGPVVELTYPNGRTQTIEPTGRIVETSPNGTTHKGDPLNINMRTATPQAGILTANPTIGIEAARLAGRIVETGPAGKLVGDHNPSIGRTVSRPRGSVSHLSDIEGKVKP